jgi:NADH dehydrogenase [ubiquinone] 1 alpha subcomplex assembly factor 7
MERLDRFMARANAAYYTHRDPYADFTTSPEISQAFGEILGLWAAVVWESMGRPDPVLLAEAGPGRATLMADALRAIARQVPDFRAALRLHLIETSPRLRASQAATLPEAVWHEDVADLPGGPLLLIANEFLDALPIRQFVRRGNGWVERFVEADAFVERPAGSDPLTLTLSPDAREREIGTSSRHFFLPLSPASGERVGEGGCDTTEGQVVEICEPARDLAALLGRRLTEQGGVALFIDYGPERSAPGDSLQAVRNGRSAAPLAEPGEADLTAHVDFQAFGDAARFAGAAVYGPLPQGLFLARLGLFQRTDRLARKQPPARAAALVAAAQRLAEPMHMGRLFKAVAIAQPGLPTPPGFEADA